MFQFSLKIALAVFVGLGVVAVPCTRGEEKTKATTAPGRPNALLDTKLLRKESVGQELNLNEKQLDKIQTIRDAIRAQHKDELAEVAKAAKTKNPLPFMRLEWKLQAEEQEALARALPTILKGEQMIRLRQISLQSLQRNSVRVFTSPDVVKALTLSEEQQKKIDVIVKETQEQMSKGVREESSRGAIEVESIRKAVALGAKKVRTEVFTEEQEQTWKEMLGKPFELKTKPGRGKLNKK